MTKVTSYEDQRASQEMLDNESIAKIRATTSLGESIMVYGMIPGHPGFKVANALVVHQTELMMKEVAKCKTPDEVMATQKYFVGLGIYVHEVQETLGEKAKEVFGSWRPPSVGSGVFSQE